MKTFFFIKMQVFIMKMIKKYWILIMIIVNIMFYRTSILESFDTRPTLDYIPLLHNYDMKKTHETCKILSNDACKSASFCVLLGGEKCVGGSKNGPTYLNKNRKKNYYYHNGICFGKCP